MKGLLILPCAVIALIAILIIRALMLKPDTSDFKPRKAVDNDVEAVKRFQKILQQKTVWNRDTNKIEFENFDTFADVLKKTYPVVAEHTSIEIVNKYGIIIKMNGKNPSLKPAIIMGHYDVVATDESEWTHPPFAAEIHDGSIIARGSVDTKCIMCATLEAMNRMISESIMPERDIYFISANNEEIGGDTTPAMAEWFKEKNIQPYIVLDEGGAVTDTLPLGITNPFATIGVTEKGSADVKLTVKCNGGHSSTPTKNDAPIQLIKALNKIADNPHKCEISEVVKEMLVSFAKYSSFTYKLIFANMWLFKPLIIKIMKRGGMTNAMISTTDALTMLSGSEQINVLPTQASAGFSVRVKPGDTVDEAVEHIKKVCANENAVFDIIYRFEPSPVSDYKSEQYSKLTNIIKKIYTDSDIAPYIMNGGTDSKHFAKDYNCVYRFAGFDFSGEERAKIHGIDESLRVESYLRGIDFYKELIETI